MSPLKLRPAPKGPLRVAAPVLASTMYRGAASGSCVDGPVRGHREAVDVGGREMQMMSR